ncbi:hypothetical protein ACFE04_010255 [Oxalis oulophora]
MSSSFPKFACILLCLTLFAIFHQPVSAAKKTYVVYLGAHQHGLEDPDQISETHYDFLGSFLGSREKARDSIFYSYTYTKHVNGFAAKLEEEDAVQIAQHPSVVSVFVNSGKRMHTTNSWEFMLLEKNGVTLPHSLWKKAKYGENVIIANIDSGVWPESKSFSDEGFGPVPSRWKGGCQNNTKEGVPCNRKLIGAKMYPHGYVQAGNDLGSGNYSARDHGGHGTHTLSTAGGNFVQADYYGANLGVIKGGAPKARVAAYKVCWIPTPHGECFDADIMNAFSAATNDGVDVISLSVGGAPSEYAIDGIAIGAWHAVMNGIVVVASGGNEGPAPGTISNVAPWIITVAASTTNREYSSFIRLGNGKHYKGVSITKNNLPKDKMYPLINAREAKLANATAEDAILCKEGTLDAKKAKGKIVACLRGEIARVAKAQEAKSAGAVAMILCNDESTGNEAFADQYVIPTTHVNYKTGQAIFSYINTTTKPLAYMTAPAANLDVKPAPFTSNFSSVGPNTITPEILKPDITAPGVEILASFKYEEDPEVPAGKTPFTFMSGTSMSCPHVAGVAALLKSVYPDWSPAAIRSAIVTTARTRDNTGHPMLSDNNGNLQKATPFNNGHGHMRPNHVADPGLIYDLTETDYLDFLCASGYNQTTINKYFTNKAYECPVGFKIRDFNYPSISVVNVTSEGVTVTRKVKNVGKPATYAVKIREPVGFSVSVKPTTLKFEKIGEEKTFKVTFKVSSHAGQDFVFGGMTWTDGKHYVRSPLVVAAGSA